MSRDEMLDDIKVMAQQQEGKYSYSYLWGMAKSLLSDENIRVIYEILIEEDDTTKCSRCETPTPTSELMEVHAWWLCGICYDDV